MIKLKDYQIEAINAIKFEFSSGSTRQYIEMPTGSGKTITFLYYAKENFNNVLIIVPSIQLLKQVYETALNFYDKRDISRKGGGYYEDFRSVHICLIQSIRGNYFHELIHANYDLVVIDECHHARADSYTRFIEEVGCMAMIEADPVRFLGVTATPTRSDGLLLSKILHTCSFQLDIIKMINKGYLSDIEGYTVKTNIDLDDIDFHNGDFSLNQLYKKLSTESRNNLVVDICKEHMKDRKCIIFCINVKHSKEINNLLNLNGFASAHIDGKTDSEQRVSILNSFRDGNIQFLCNCQLLTEGFDEPSIDGIILARPTISRALFIQMIGRGLRLFPVKNNCKIIDIVDNHSRTASFNQIITEDYYKPIESFKSIRDIETYVNEKKFEVTEFVIQKANFFNSLQIHENYATESTIEYLNKNNVYYQQPLTFDEGSFLVWYDKLKKEFNNGNN